MAVVPTALSATLSQDEPPGIRFFTGSWKDVLAEAKRQNKPVFLDIYTTWCPPCKRMAKEAFPNPKIGAKFNVHFINYHLDAEQGEGVDLAKKYTVSSYPTALYITPDGDLIHRSVGYGGIKAMIDQADIVLAMPRLRATVAKGDKDYADGRRDLTFLKKYLNTCQLLNRPTSDVLDAYVDALPEPERSTDEAIAFVAGAIQSSNTKAFDYLIKNRPSLISSDLAKQRLAATVFGALFRVLANDFKQASATNDEALLEKVILNNERNTTSANPLMIRQDAQKQEAANDYRLRFFKQTKNFVKYRAIAGTMAQQQLMSQSVADLHKLDTVAAIRMNNLIPFVPDSIRKTLTNALADQSIKDRFMSWRVAHSLYEIADTYRELGVSSADWVPALEWAERSMELDRTHACLNTYARLLQKLGRTNEALNAQKEAILEAGKIGWKTDEYENELAEMKQK